MLRDTNNVMVDSLITSRILGKLIFGTDVPRGLIGKVKHNLNNIKAFS